jgi:hypothetical protein
VERRSVSQWPRRRPGYVFRFRSMAAMTRLLCKGTGAWWMGGVDPRMPWMPVSVRGWRVEEMGMELEVGWLGWTDECLTAVRAIAKSHPHPRHFQHCAPNYMSRARPAATSLARCQVPRMDRRPSGASDSVGLVSRWCAAQIGHVDKAVCRRPCATNGGSTMVGLSAPQQRLSARHVLHLRHIDLSLRPHH